MAAIQFQSIEKLHTKKSLFNKSFEHTTAFDMGMLIPIMIEEAIPSDVWQMSCRFIIRFAPLVSPVLHPIYAKTFTFFVPYRLLFPKRRNQVELADIEHNWENFITGGEDGMDTTELPVWNYDAGSAFINGLADYMGLPMENPENKIVGVHLPAGSRPHRLFLRAYNFIYNEFFRDQNYMDWQDLDYDQVSYACWEKDYFTSVLPFLQRGEAKAVPISALGSAEWDDLMEEQFFPNMVGMQHIWTTNKTDWTDNSIKYPSPVGVGQGTGSGLPVNFQWTDMYLFNSPVPNPVNAPNDGRVQQTIENSGGYGQYTRMGVVTNLEFRNYIRNYLNNNVIDFQDIGGIDIQLLRLSFQVQKWLERNARCGARYVEQLQARFGEDGGDVRLDRPEFIGGTKTPIIISEVLQTAQNNTTVGRQPNTALGTMAGHGITADESKIGTYRVKEHGVIMTLLCVRPETCYAQGIDLKWTRRTRYDFLQPEFVNLSEQAVFNRELYCDPTDETYNEEIFGYQGRYNEYRYSKNYATGLMRQKNNGFAHWNLCRLFDHTSRPIANREFLLCKPDKRIFAVPSEPGIFCNYGAINHVVRPLPIIPEPGLVDHH